MLTLVAPSLEEYAARHSAPESAVLQALVKETYARMDIPQMQVGRLEGAFLRLLLRLIQARHVLEIGTFTGYSALAMAEGLPPEGRVITCDIDESAAAMARKHWAKSPHGRKIELHLAPALETLKTLKCTFDLVFIDADKENYVRYWEASLPKLRSGGLLVADNALWGGRVLNPQDATDRAIAAFNAHAKSDSRVETVLLTVRDGMMLAWKK